MILGNTEAKSSQHGSEKYHKYQKQESITPPAAQ